MTPLKPMLAKDALLGKLTFPLFVQPKLDGVRATVQGGKVYSRSLKLIPNAEVQRVLGRPEFEGLDGELIVGSPTAEDCYRQTSSFVMSESKRGADWCFFVFDILGHATANYSHRLAVLREASVAFHVMEPNHIAVVATESAADADELEAMEAKLIADGHEGVIARTDAPYKHGRSGKTGPLLKIKRFVDFECVVLDTYEEMHNGNVGFTNELGRTARSTAQAGKVGKGTLGGLVLSPVDDSVVPSDITFRCGTGFDAAERASLWAERDALPGRTAKIKSFPVGVKDKPRHPVFLGWRDLSVDG